MQTAKRYPGVRPFQTGDKDLFFGRARDIADLSDLIALERLVVLFGKSGYGKSSLLNAGIIPALDSRRDEDEAPLLPVVIRLGSYQENTSLPPTSNVVGRLQEKAAPAPEMAFMDSLPLEASLWHAFKRRQTPENQRYLLVFDQFEEFFTYPIDQQVAFKAQLAELLYQDTPQPVREATAHLERAQRRALAQPMTLKVVFAIRSDRMSLLDSMKDRLPAILQKRYELAALTPEQAREAIVEPAAKAGDFASPAFAYSPAALTAMTEKLAATQGVQRAGIEAFQLQILCEYIEDKVINGEVAANRVEPSHFADRISEVFEGYYQRLIHRLAPDVQPVVERAIEEKLIYVDPATGEARRLSVDAGVLQTEAGLSEAMLNQLESAFLLRREATATGGFTYEVSHDTLIAPILKSKTERKTKEREARERAATRKRRRRLAAIGTAVLLVLAGITSLGIYMYQNNVALDAALAQAKVDKANALEAKAKADQALNDMLVAQRKAEEIQKAKELAEFRATLKDVETILKGGNCPPPDVVRLIDSTRRKYPSDTALQAQIQTVTNQLARCVYKP